MVNNQAIVVNAVGDLMLAEKVGESIAQRGGDYLFDNVRPFLSIADITIGNLEGPLSDRGKPFIQKDFIFRASPEWAKHLKKAGFDIVCLANNHILDYGYEAFYDTLAHLKKAGISYVGTGKNLKEAIKPLIVEINNLKVAFLAFTYAFPAKKNTPGCCSCDLKHIQKLIKSVKPNADLVIVSVHHGLEYIDYPSRHIISLFRNIVDAGANLVLGHHPHVVQGLETYRDSLIVYSLGNFISSYPDKEARKKAYQKTALSFFTDSPPAINDMRPTESFILQCKLKATGIEDYKLIPVKSNPDFQVEIMDEREAGIFLERIQEISEKLFNLEEPVFDEIDALLEKCRQDGLQKITFRAIIRKIHHIRPKHLMMLRSFLKAKLGRGGVRCVLF